MNIKRFVEESCVGVVIVVPTILFTVGLVCLGLLLIKYVSLKFMLEIFFGLALITVVFVMLICGLWLVGHSYLKVKRK